MAAGGFTATVDFWNGPLTSAGARDAIVARFEPAPLPVRRPVTFDGGNRADIGVFRPQSGLHFALLTGGGTRSLNNFGQPGDQAF